MSREVALISDPLREANEFLGSQEGAMLVPYFRDFLLGELGKVKEIADYRDSLRWHQHLKRSVRRKIGEGQREVKAIGETLPEATALMKEMVGMFDSIETLPIVSTKMAWYGAVALAGSAADINGDGVVTPDEFAKVKQRKENWFGGMEKMMRAAHAWRLVGIATARAKGEMEHDTTRVMGGAEKKVEFVQEMYQEMERKGVENQEQEAKRFYQVLAKYLGLNKDQLKGLAENDPMLMPYIYTVVTGKTGVYERELAKEMWVKNALGCPKITMGVVSRERANSQPELKFGRLLGVKLDRQYDLSEHWMGTELTKMEQDYAVEEEDRPQVWLSSAVNLNEVFGEESSFATYVREIGAVEKPILELALPVSTKEAKLLMEWELEQKEKLLKRILIAGWYKRLGGIGTMHGFGAQRGGTLTPAHAKAAWEATEILVGKKVEEVTASDLANPAMLEQKLVGRVMEAAFIMMGSQETGVEVKAGTKPEDAAGSMERGAWYGLEVVRAMGLLRQEEEGKPTVLEGHSMGGQILKRIGLIMPESVRELTWLVAVTPLLGTSSKLTIFMDKGQNMLAREVIRLRGEGKKLGEILVGAGKLLRINPVLIRGMLWPKKWDGEVSRFEGDTMFAAHDASFEKEVSYLYNQRANLKNEELPFCNFTIEELLDAIGIATGGNLIDLMGKKDQVLAYGENMKCLRRRGVGMWYRERELAGMTEETMQRRQGEDSDHRAEVWSGDFPHYPTLMSEGRKALRGAVRAQFGRMKGGV